MTALLKLEHISKMFARGGLLSAHRIAAVRDVSFTIAADKAEILTVIGESGSGKSTLARMILGIHMPTAGTLELDGRNIAKASHAERRAFMATVQPIFQNPFEAFNPLKKLDRYLFMTAERFGGAAAGQAAETAADAALKKVGLSLAEVRGRFPHELSGGDRQSIRPPAR
jgi:peptide/nickel transport system ATP-binding protein